MLKVYYVTGTIQSPVHASLNLIRTIPRGVNTVNLMSQMGKLRHKDIK